MVEDRFGDDSRQVVGREVDEILVLDADHPADVPPQVQVGVFVLVADVHVHAFFHAVEDTE